MSEGKGSTSNRTQIAIAVITTVGVIATGLFANWDKLFPSDPSGEAPRESRGDGGDASGENLFSAAAGQRESPGAPTGGGVQWARSEELLDSAVLEGLRMFESAAATPPTEERIELERFAAEASRYIGWELALTHPEPPEERVPLPLGFRYLDGEGRPVAEHTFDSYVEADWRTSRHASKWGRSAAGWWRPGLYRVEVRFGERLLAEKTFEVYASAPPPTTPESLRDGISGIQVLFYETPGSLRPRDSRDYETVFDPTRTRFVGWELNLDHRRRPERRIAFPVDAVLRTPSGEELARHRLDAAVEADWTSSWHSRAFGWDEPGRWAAGTYVVELSMLDRLLAVGSFVID